MFQNFPELEYTLNTGKVITIKDFFRKAKIETSSLDSIIEYQYYEILDGERPDVVATKLYGDGDLHWTFFLVNDFDNYYDWHMDLTTFEIYMNAKFPGQTINARLSTDIVSSASKFLVGETLTSNLGKTAKITRVEPSYNRISIEGSDTFVTPVYPDTETVTGTRSGKSFEIESVTEHRDAACYYKNAAGDRRNYPDTANPPVWTAVSHYTEEYDENETNRRIKIISPSKIGTVLREFERIMSDE